MAEHPLPKLRLIFSIVFLFAAVCTPVAFYVCWAGIRLVYVYSFHRSRSSYAGLLDLALVTSRLRHSSTRSRPGISSHLSMYLIWLVHHAGRGAKTMGQFYVKLAWSVTALQQGIHPEKHWDGSKSQHPKACLYLNLCMAWAFLRRVQT